MRKALVWLLILGFLGAGGYFAYRKYVNRSSSDVTYRFAKVRRSDVLSTISATGTIVPEDVIDVGAQVNGQIASFGKDKDGKQIDYRSSVDAGMLLAKIDDALYVADVSTAQALLEQNKAQVLVAEANREQARAKLDQAQRDWDRAQKLGQSKAISQADYDASKSTYEQGVANLALAEATISQAKASVSSAEASVFRAKKNLAYCTINSPVSGVIIDRRVEIGQTVVASMNAPSLFLIAKDLSRMTVLVQVNEADIGQIGAGRPVTFTVDAFPNDVFKGQVRKIRLNATMTQNVVTYTAEIVAENPDLKLLPYLTANVRFIVDKSANALNVPNAALRWLPPASAVVAATSSPGAPSETPREPKPSDAKSDDQKAAVRPTGDRPGTPANSEKSPKEHKGAGRTPGAERAGAVWVLDQGGIRRVDVRIGVSDGLVTAIESDELHEGDQVIVGEQVASAAAPNSTTNPFAPQMGQRPRGR
jgi:HlyD family secretion protein